jgi:hypothetical protein
MKRGRRVSLFSPQSIKAYQAVINPFLSQGAASQVPGHGFPLLSPPLDLGYENMAANPAADLRRGGGPVKGMSKANQHSGYLFSLFLGNNPEVLQF